MRLSSHRKDAIERGPQEEPSRLVDVLRRQIEENESKMPTLNSEIERRAARVNLLDQERERASLQVAELAGAGVADDLQDAAERELKNIERRLAGERLLLSRAREQGGIVVDNLSRLRSQKVELDRADHAGMLLDRLRALTESILAAQLRLSQDFAEHFAITGELSEMDARTYGPAILAARERIVLGARQGRQGWRRVGGWDLDAVPPMRP